MPQVPPNTGLGVGQPGAAQFGTQPPGFVPQNIAPPGAVLGNPNLNAFGSPYGPPGYPPQAFPQPAPYAPYPPGPAQFGATGVGGQPQGIFGQQYPGTYFPSANWLNNFEQGKYLRVVQEIHYHHTWLEGSRANEVDVHDAEIGFTLNWPNFLGSGEPFQVSPVFIFHFWDGPQPPSAADLPSRAYSTFLAGSWTTPRNRNIGGEVISSVGIYTDFNTFTSRSLRVKGTGLGWIRFTPKMVFKFGVEYINRLDVKIFPAGGLFWQPNDRLDLELYFPSPKIKYKLQQIGNIEVTGYLTAGYGGDSWTIKRDAGFSDQIDLIDLRVLGGVEFVGVRGFRSFFEAGYAFDREILYRVNPAESTKLSDSAIIRAGFLF